MEKNSTAKWLRKTSRPQHKNMVVLILFNAIFSILTVSFAFIVKEIIDSAVIYKDYKRLITFCIILVLIVLLQFVSRVLINGLTDRIKARCEVLYRTRIFSFILNKKQDKISIFHSGELMTRLTSDVSVVSEGLSTIVPVVVSSVVRLLSGVIALIIIDWVFAIAFLISGVSVALIIYLMRLKLKSLHKKEKETDGKARSFMQEIIENNMSIKAFSEDDKITERATELNEDNYRVKVKKSNYAVLGHGLYNVIYSAGYLFALIYGGIKILNNMLTFGELTAILQLVNNVQVPFASLSNLVPKYYAMMASAERLMEIEDIECEQPLLPFDEREVYSSMKGISAENVSFDYDGKVVLRSASTYINKGEFVAINSQSGQGKSTLLQLMLGIYDVNDGELYIDTDGGKIPLSNSTRKLFSYVPQGNMIYSGTIYDNLTFINGNVNDEDIEKALKISDAYDFVSELSHGLDTVIGEQGLGLSEGQIQRLAISRALLTDSPVIILDEATSGLDERSERVVFKNLKALDNKTIIVVSHRKAVYEVADSVIEIKNKKLEKKFIEK